jgi:voltage-gated potassium channel
VPEAIKFFRFIFTQTPFLTMMTVIAVLWPLFALFLYLAEHTVNPDLSNYGNAIWWGLVAMTSMGTTYPPLTGLGQLAGGTWAFVGCIIFYGAIIASMTTYISKRKSGTVKQIISTVEHNLEHLEELSLDELTLLKETLNAVINEQTEVSKVRAQGSQSR